MNVVSKDGNQKIAIRCSGIAKTYETDSTQVLALRGVGLKVQQGELFMLVGPSG